MINLLLIVFVGSEIDKFKLEIGGTRDLANSKRRMLVDLDHNGSLETVDFRSMANDFSTIRIVSTEGLISEIKVLGRWMSPRAQSFLDMDGDGKMEILAFTAYKDSIWLNLVDHFEVLTEYPIEALDPEFSIENYDYSVEIAGTFSGKLIFAINAGYPTYPRSIYVLDLSNGEMKRSMELGSLLKQPYLFDLDLDGRPEVITRSFAPENIHYHVPYTDSSAWLRIFDLGTSHVFDPIEYRFQTSHITVLPVRTDSANYLAVSHTYNGLREVTPRITLVDSAGQEVSVSRAESNRTLIPINSELFIYHFDEERVYKSDAFLNQVKVVSSGIQILPLPTDFYDWDDDGDAEFFSLHADMLYVFDTDFSLIGELELPERMIEGQIGNYGQILLFSQGKEYAVKVRKSILFIWRFPIFLVTIVIEFFVIIRLRSRRSKSLSHIILPVGRKKRKVLFSELEYLETAGGPYTNVYLNIKDKPLLITKNIGALEKQLPSDQFVRISRKHIVKKGLITEVGKNEVTISTKHGESTLETSKKIEF